MEHIAEAVKQAQAYLRDHPDEARYPDSNATAVMNDGLLCTVSGPGGASMQTDMPASVGGSALAAPPGWYMRAAAASCVATLMAMRAATLGKTLPGLSVTVGSESDDRGILAVDEALPSGPLSMSITETAVSTPQNPEMHSQIAGLSILPLRSQPFSSKVWGE